MLIAERQMSLSQGKYLIIMWILQNTNSLNNPQSQSKTCQCPCLTRASQMELLILHLQSEGLWQDPTKLGCLGYGIHNQSHANYLVFCVETMSKDTVTV